MTRPLVQMAALLTLVHGVALCGCAPDLVVEDTPRPPLEADVIDLRTGDSLRVEVLLQQSARTTEACVEVLDVSSGSTTTGRRCEPVGRAVQSGAVSVSVDIPALPFGAVVVLGVTSRDFVGADSTPLVVTGTPDRDPPPLASFTLAEDANGNVALAWTLAAEPYGTTTVRVIRRPGEAPIALDDANAVVVYDGPATALTHTDTSVLFADPLGYAAFALDAKGVVSAPLTATTTP